MPLRPRKRRDGTVEPGVWELVIELPRRYAGDRRRKVMTFRGPRKQAEAELRRQQAAADAGKLTTGRLTVGDVFDRYLEEHVRTRLAPLTYTSYRFALTDHAARLRAVPLAKLQRHHLAAHEAYLSTEAKDRRTWRKGRPGVPLSATTVARYLNPVKSALDWAESVDLLARNPARTWRIPQTAPAERRHFDQAQARRFLAAVTRSSWAPHLLTLAATGVRLSELRGLRWTDVDLDAGTYQIHQQWQTVMVQTPQADGTLTWKTTDVRRPLPKSRAGLRGGGLPDAVCDVLREWRTRQKAARLAAGRAWRDPEGGALVFADERTGGPFTAGTLRTHFYRLCRAERLERLALHDLRHTWVTLQLEAGTAEHLVPQLAGHSPRVDAQVYRHMTARAGKDAAERLWAFLAPDGHNKGHNDAEERGATR